MTNRNQDMALIIQVLQLVITRFIIISSCSIILFCSICDICIGTEKEYHEELDKLLDVLGVDSPFNLVIQVGSELFRKDCSIEC